VAKAVGDPKNQHTVQRALLIGFAGKDKRLRCRNRRSHDWSLPVKTASTEKFFYTFDDEDGTRRFDIDDAMRERVETPFPKLRTAVQTGALTAGLRDEFNLYVAFSLMRTRTVRDFMLQADAFAGPYARRTEMAFAYNRNVSRMSPGEANALNQVALALMRARPQSERDKRIRQLRTFLDLTDKAFKSLSVLKWKHHTFDSPVLLTSDAGVGVLRKDSGFGGVFPHRGIAVLPLSPTSLAVAATNKQHKELPDGDVLATLSNQALADVAHQQTYRHPDMPWPELIRFDEEPPKLDIRIDHRRAEPVDATNELAARYARPGMHPLLSGLLAVLNTALPLELSE
jgi:hypothetical protein